MIHFSFPLFLSFSTRFTFAYILVDLFNVFQHVEAQNKKLNISYDVIRRMESTLLRLRVGILLLLPYPTNCLADRVASFQRVEKHFRRNRFQLERPTTHGVGARIFARYTAHQSEAK